MLEITGRYTCPVCKQKTSTKHCKSPTCTWSACHKHPAPDVATYFTGDKYFIVRKESRRG